MSSENEINTALQGAVVSSEVVDSPRDSVNRTLGYVIIGLVVVGLTGVLYVLLAGIVNPPSPRTLTETELVIAEAGVRTSPQSGDAWSDYVGTLTRLERYREAESQLEKGRKQLKGQNLLKINLAGVDLYGKMADNEKSLKLAEQCVEDYKKLEAEQIKTEAAKGITVAREQVAPKVATKVYFTAARAAARSEKWKVATTYLTEALFYDPLGSDILVARGDMYAKMGESDKARADFEKALEYIPDYAPAKQGLDKLGDSE